MKELDAEKIYGEIVKAGEEWSDADAAATILEECKKSVLAELTNQAVENSMAAKESKALADPVYRLHITNMVEARRKANRAKVKYEGVKLLGDLRRSEESTRRALMRNA